MMDLDAFLIVVKKKDEEIEKLKATLDGDPSMTANRETRLFWRASAIRYADKVEDILYHICTQKELRAAVDGVLNDEQREVILRIIEHKDGR